MSLVETQNTIILPENIKVTESSGAIDLYENIFTEEISKKLIEAFEEANNNPSCPIKYSNALIGDGNDGGSVRSNLTMSIFEHNDIHNNPCLCQINSAVQFIKDQLSLFVRHYCIKYDLEIAFDEGLQVLKYSPGRQYKVHTDYGPGVEHRVLSGLIYINPGEYEGGGTYFSNFNHTVNPDSPALALFPSNYAYRHAARPVFDGYKYAIVTWFGPPWAVNRWQR
jgi:Rps23 Pro-64 3,4-dihydroxylase Tpa1-like proline 4-hydroxylase